MPIRDPSLTGVIRQHRLQVPQPHGKTLRGARTISGHITAVTRQAQQRPAKATKVDSDQSKPLDSFDATPMISPSQLRAYVCEIGRRVRS
jgi:hypothetical protein